MPLPGWCYNGKSAAKFACRNTSNTGFHIILFTLSDSFISLSQLLHSSDEKPLNWTWWKILSPNSPTKSLPRNWSLPTTVTSEDTSSLFSELEPLLVWSFSLPLLLLTNKLSPAEESLDLLSSLAFFGNRATDETKLFDLENPGVDVEFSEVKLHTPYNLRN